MPITKLYARSARKVEIERTSNRVLVVSGCGVPTLLTAPEWLKEAISERWPNLVYSDSIPYTEGDESLFEDPNTQHWGTHLENSESDRTDWWLFCLSPDENFGGAWRRDRLLDGQKIKWGWNALNGRIEDWPFRYNSPRWRQFLDEMDLVQADRKFLGKEVRVWFKPAPQ